MSDRQNLVKRGHNYGYILRGIRSVSHVLKVGGKRLTVVAAMLLHGVEDIYIAEGTVNGDVFEDYTRKTWLPLLWPFNGTNHTCVVMDNAAIHHVNRIEMIQISG